MPLLTWLTRETDLKLSQNAPYRLLKEVTELSAGEPVDDNLLIHGDNLDALKALLPYYAGQVKCIFIDPPYNTKSAFAHYDDNLEHSKWLAMIYPRLELLREFLTEDGSIWVSIDDNEGHYLKVIMDEVFGRRNFSANCLWQKVYSERMDARGFSNSHDHILVYQKSDKFQVKQLAVDQNASQFGFFDEVVGKYYRRRSLRKEGSESRRTDRPSMWYPIEAPDGSEIWPVKPDGTEGRWRWKKDNIVPNQAQLEYVKKEARWEIYVKQYIETSPTRPPATLWLMDEVGHNHEAKIEVRAFNQNDVFDTPKPERLIKRILDLATNPGDLVLDSFLGSATTAAVAHKMGRRYIGIEMGAHALTHCAPRLKKVIEGEQGGISKVVDWKGGGGFRFYELGDAIFDEYGSINKNVTFDVLAAHIWFCESRKPWAKPAVKTTLLGVHDDTAYHLLFNGILGDKHPEGGNILTKSVLKELPPHEGPMVIYGEEAKISEESLRRKGITFRQIPYDIKAR